MSRLLSLAVAACVLLLQSSILAREWKDASGKFKIEAELVAVRNGKVVLEKPDGTIISVQLDKLCAADQTYLKEQDKPKTPAPAPVPAAPTTKSPAAPAPTTPASGPAVSGNDGAALAEKAVTVLRTSCYRCHGEDGASEGGFNFALNLKKLASTLVKPRNAAASALYQRMTATGDTAMPPVGESPRPAAADLAIIKSWIEAGAPELPSQPARKMIANDEVVKLISADIQKAGERSRRFLRYFTLTHLYNADISEDELQTYRNAFTKLINSLSWNTTLLVPQTLDPERTIFRIDMRDLHWNVAMWEQVEQANPYFIPLTSADAIAAAEAAQCQMPYVRADWFVYAACKPPLYHVMLGVPETDLELENLLRVNVAANIDQEQAIRAAFNRSGVSQNNRLIEWHKSPYGSYWKSYDFGGNAGQQNLFEHPLGPTGDEGFKHDGGELIFTLPNGLQGYLLVDSAGKRIDHGPTNIVSDPKRPDKTVTNGVSCMSCHYTGVISKSDEVGPAVRANPKAYKNSEDILALYRKPADLNRLFEEDGKRFAGAMKKVGLNSLSRSGEPISCMAQRFEQELDLQLAACEFGLPVDDFLKRLDGSDAMSRRFAALRTPGGVIKRDVFATGFGEAVVELKLVLEARVTASSSKSSTPAPMPTPRVGSSPSAGKAGEVCRFGDLSWGVKSLAFSPSGTLLAAGKPDRALRLFDVSKQSQTEALEKLELLQSVEACIFTPATSRFLACGRTGHIMVFDVSKDGHLKASGQFAGHSQDVKSIAVSVDGKFALSGGQEKKVRYWSIDKGEEVAVFGDFQGPIKACFISRDGRTGMATDGATLQELNLAGKASVKSSKQLAQSWAGGQAAAFSADGTYAAVGDSYDIRLFNLKTGKELPKMAAGEIQWSLAFTPDSTRLLSGGADKVNIWDVRKQKRVYSQEVADSGYIHALAVAPDNKHAAATGRSDVLVFRLP